MPRYFFHVHDDLDTEDHEGLDLRDLAAAEAGAVHSARSLMCDTLMQGRLNLNHRIDIENEGGTVLSTVRFGDAVEIEN